MGSVQYTAHNHNQTASKPPLIAEGDGLVVWVWWGCSLNALGPFLLSFFQFRSRRGMRGKEESHIAFDVLRKYITPRVVLNSLFKHGMGPGVWRPPRLHAHDMLLLLLFFSVCANFILMSAPFCATSLHINEPFPPTPPTLSNSGSRLTHEFTCK